MDGLFHDLRQAARGLIRSPVFAATATLTLALGIGANTTAFGVMNAVFLRPLPFDEPGRLVMLWETHAVRQRDRNVVSPANFLDWQRQSSSFTGLATFSDWRTSLTGTGEPEQVRIGYTSASFFPVLGVAAALGRALAPADEARGAPAVAVLSHGLWQRKFGGDAAVVGRSISLGGRPHTVVGIMPDGFAFPESRSEVWTPLGLDPTIDYRQRSGRFLVSFARLKPGVSIAQAQADVSTIARRLEAEYPSFNTSWGVRVVPLLDDVVGPARRGLVVVGGAVALVLLIACANVANLLLVRATTREREIAMRSALGAGRGRVARLLLLESMLLAGAGGAVGILLATWGTSALAAYVGAFLPRAQDIAVDGGVLAFAVGISVFTALLFGSVPSWRSARADLHALLQGGSRQTSRGMRARHALVSGQVALTLVLLVGAGLLGRSFLRLTAVDPGFDPEGVLTFRIDLPGTGYPTPERQTAFFETLLAELRAKPDVRSAGAITWLPLSGLGSATSVFIEGRPVPPPGERLAADIRGVDPDYFRTMRMSVLQGEVFTSRHTADTPRDLVISQAVARSWFPGSDPIGQVIRMPWGDTLRGRIIGVVGDMHHLALDSMPRQTLYWAMPQFPSTFMTIVVRTSGDPMRLAPLVREAVRRLDATLPLAELKPMTAYLGDSTARRRFLASALGAFAAVALALAMVGLYGALAYSVAQRTREIGVRVALGARRQSVLRMVLGEGLRVTAVGLAVGGLAALAATRALATLLFGVSPRDATTFFGMALALVGVALVASYVPARRALAVNPVDALRQD